MSITPADVNRLERPTDGFLCPLSANTFGIDFLNFSILDYDTKKTIFEVGRDCPTPPDISIDMSSLGEDMYRKIKYTFSEDVLKLPFIQTTLMFSVGNKELRDFRMIERHYFRDTLVKSFDFSFGFCIPGSTNTWDAVYSVPNLSPELVDDMINHPFETRSDSFYFVDNRLIMHNKAAYKYIREDAAQAKKSYEDKYTSKASKASKPAAKEGKISSSTSLESSSSAFLEEDVRAEAKSTSTSGGRIGGGGGGSKASKEPSWSKETDYF